MARTGRIRRRWPRAMVVGMVLSAILSWVLLVDQGTSTARVLAAVATTTGSIISVIRLRRELRDGTEREV